ncbi:uroporphyrinogen-III synthase [Streptomyces sp. 71268]|uniref:uroporphyrinogen-III synthase n=1 Tax=Streptomyces sp. 71268 TaxID=3002640 RepID=UPI0023F6589C|nr:uroporphyrinogen-III synthase [Streptomyces sp. 71268]WEV27528.1 uroporphyrinogen-III synthase [Streptomyces sp. 71268]
MQADHDQPTGADGASGPERHGGGEAGVREDGDQERGAGRGGTPLVGFTVGVTAARRAEELIALVERRGATVVHAPAMRTVPLADDGELRSATRQLVERAPDVVIATTAVGFRGWAEAADGWGLGDALLDRFRGAELLARGPKVRGAIRAAGLTEDWSPASESMAEVLDRLLANGVAGRRIAVQLHGEPLTEFVAALRDAGADVVGVPVYRWLPPEDPGPLDGLIDAAVARTVDAITFTSAPAATSLLDRAHQRGLRDALVDALRRDVLAACVGPVTARPLAAYEVPTAAPERFRLGPLVQLLCQELPARAPVLRVGGHGVAVRGRVALVDGEPRAVTPAQAALLRALSRRPGQVVASAELSRALPDPVGGEGAVGAAVAGLDAALGVSGLVEAVADGGYRLAAPEPDPDAGAWLGDA